MLTEKPASAAAPPDADVALAPSKVNWKPPIGDELEYHTSIESVVAAPKEIMLSKQLVPSPSHTPHASFSNVEPQVLSQPDGPASKHPQPRSSALPPSHTPQSSITASPPHSPLQSSTVVPSHIPAQSRVLDAQSGCSSIQFETKSLEELGT